MRFFIYKLLDYPFIYKLSQSLLGSVEKVFFSEHLAGILKEARADLLNVGCGPGRTAVAPPGVVYGVDLNLKYVQEYSTHPSQCGVTGSALELPFKTKVFGETRCVGLLHHLDEAQAIKSICEMDRCTRQGGRVIVIDSVWPQNPWARPIAWLIRRLDRGEWVRNEEQLKGLAQKACGGSWQAYRYTYSPVGHEVLALIRNK